MKQIRIVALFILISFLISSCTSINTGNTGVLEKIQSPQNKLIPVSGMWTIETFKQGEQKLSEDQLSKLIDRNAIFHEKVAVLADDYCYRPVYKIKNVNSFDYLLYHHKVAPKDIGIEDSTVQIVTITSENKFFYEFIKVEEDKIIVNIDGTFFYLKKTSDDIDSEYIEEYLKKDKELVGKDRFENEGVLFSGILLGLKSYKKSNTKQSNGEWIYRTIWIPGRNGSIDNIYETKDLFVPRKNGFWKIETRHGVESNMEALYARNVDSDALLSHGFCRPTMEILYVGNDYLSVEYSENIKDESSNNILIKNLLKVLPIDNIESEKAVKISDIAGVTAQEALYESAVSHVTTYIDNNSKNLNIIPDEESFAVVRRTGHWIIKGRLNFLEKGGTDVDFNIKVVPPTTLVAYDELCLSWNAIKSQVPEMVDAYTSPNGNIAILITNNNILVYTIEGNELSDTPSRKIRLRDKETVVMAEWAEGKYTDKWEKEFLKNDVIEIKE